MVRILNKPIKKDQVDIQKDLINEIVKKNIVDKEDDNSV